MPGLVQLSMAAFVAWGRIVFCGPNDAEKTTAWIGGPGAPDLGAVDSLARSQLEARRLGGFIRLYDLCEELEELLDFVGLRREVGGKPEGGEDVRVEEGVKAGDPVARDLEDL